jgi:hypothetical protein
MEQVKLSSRLALKRFKLKTTIFTVCFCFVCRLETAMEQERENMRHQVDSALDRFIQSFYSLVANTLLTVFVQN